MDILQDVKKAEQEADRVEQEYRRKAEQLSATAAAEVLAKRQELERQLELEIADYRSLLEESAKTEEQGAIRAAEDERRRVESVARSRMDTVVQHLLQELDS